VSELRRLARETGHSRFPVFGENLDDVVGIAHLKDTFRVKPERRPITPVAEIAGRALLVPDTRPLDQVLGDRQKQGRGLAVVVDEYGGTAGIVTVEDLLEEIFGEIEDEHDPEPNGEAQADGVDLLSGLLHRHEIEELIGFEWPEGRYETLGGLLVAQLGRFPRPGEVVKVGDGWEFEIVTVDGHRVDRVALRSRPVDRRRTDDADEEPR
jgi:CBS domain containing-hemolysin-like protein